MLPGCLLRYEVSRELGNVSVVSRSIPDREDTDASEQPSRLSGNGGEFTTVATKRQMRVGYNYDATARVEMKPERLAAVIAQPEVFFLHGSFIIRREGAGEVEFKTEQPSFAQAAKVGGAGRGSTLREHTASIVERHFGALLIATQ